MKKTSAEWDQFLDLFVRVHDLEGMETLFALFFTMNEREMLQSRYRIVRELLTSELPQREIAEKLSLSISKITAGSKALQLLTEKQRTHLAKAMRVSKTK